MTVTDALSLRLGEHLAGLRFDSLPTHVVEVTRASLADAIGVTLAAGKLGQGCLAVVEMARASGGGPSGVIGHGFRTSAAMAAMANGAMAHAMDYEDTFDAALVHPHGAVVPAALAVAESIGGVNGRELLTAIAAGADLTCRLGVAIGESADRRNWNMRPMLGAFGATAAAGRLMGLDATRMVEALSLAFCQATCTNQHKTYAASHLREIRDGLCAHAGVLSAEMARRGIRGFHQPLEGEAGLFAQYAGGDYRRDALLDGLGHEFLGSQVSFKPWPSCRGTHAFIEAALALRAAHGLDADRIERIDVVVSSTFAMLCNPIEQKRRPETAIDAKFSIPFTVGAAMLRGRVSLAEFLPAALHDPAIAALAQRVSGVVEPAWRLGDALRGQLTVRTTGGEVLTSEVDQPAGSPSKPMTGPQLEDKFLDCCRYAADAGLASRATALLERVRTIERCADVATLFD